MNVERMHPALRDWLHCMRETEAMQASVCGGRPVASAALPEPRGPKECCRCGKTTRRPPKVWVRVGNRAWCFHCQRLKQGAAQIKRARSEAAGEPGGAVSPVPETPGVEVLVKQGVSDL